MGSLGSVADVLEGEMGGLIKSVIAGIIFAPIMSSIDLGWQVPPLP
ncbi:hypothetical protein M2405_003937 [Rhodococcus erythropolis]|nr:hypothetical protein [Rhodococcus erythropolis]MCW2429225.1 hypothetical protein [Rhodococcus erythropolis]MDJ0107631.1 hypothetical protein [Rhodococcus erythropolis]OQM81101.1 hypothetical protein B0E55_03243 [Rhodococcus sp. 66b]SUE08552.1 Uncharacterised protein [Rhodococcus erythropolis]